MTLPFATWNHGTVPGWSSSAVGIKPQLVLVSLGGTWVLPTNATGVPAPKGEQVQLDGPTLQLLHRPDSLFLLGPCEVSSQEQVAYV